MHTHHHHSEENTPTSAAPFKKALIIASFFMVMELVGGLIANSLALVTDALHLFTDIGSLALALLIVRIIALPKNQKMSYGYYRAEILGALASALVLLVLCGFITYEGILRVMHPSHVAGEMVFVIAILGLLANIWMMRILHPVQHNDLNAKAAYLHVLGDLLGSVGVVLSGLLIWITGWNIFDPLITLLFSIILCWSASKIIRKSVRILMQATPEGFDSVEIGKALAAIPGVKEVHDLHVWSISSQRVALSAHLIVEPPHDALQEAHRVIEDKYHIHYMTIQIEEVAKFESRFCYDTDEKIIT
jgi:cobalt-zinc-cadmium efflux system protein